MKNLNIASISGFLILMLVLFSNCKKETDNDDGNGGSQFDHYTGNYYCEVNYNYNYPTDVSNRIYDYVIRIEVSDNQITVLGHEIPIVSWNETHYELMDIDGIENRSLSLDFSNDYSNVQIVDHFPSQSFGPSENFSFIGSKTDLPVTSDPHPLIADLEGFYNLSVDHVSSFDNTDTTYQTVLYVTKSGSSIEIGDDTFFSGDFHSYMNRTTLGNSSFAYENSDMNLFWANDSLFFEYSSFTDWFDVEGVDSLTYTFHGTK